DSAEAGHAVQPAADFCADQRCGVCCRYGLRDRELRDGGTNPERRGGAAVVCGDRLSRRAGVGTDCGASISGIREVESRPLPTPSISVFFPCYNDGKTIGDLVVEAERQLQQLTDDYEVIVVNDG